LQNGIFAGFYNQVADEEENSRLILTVGLVFNIASAVMALVGAIGLLTALSISVFERQREIGVMRSIGAGSRTIAGQFLTEGLLVGLAAWVIGVPVSYGLSQVLLTALPLDDFGFRYPPISLAIGLVGMLVIATLASLWPSLAAARKTVSDILRYQ
jgi:putative ABC transport system permease protein